MLHPQLDSDLDGARVLCHQCGIRTFPHFNCRCRTCGRRHATGAGCPRPTSPSSRQSFIPIDQRPAPETVARSPMFKVALRYSARPTISDIGAMIIACPFCGSLKWPKEKMNCCGNGDIQLAPADIIPPALAATQRCSQMALTTHVLS